jgi:pyrimidine-nucleoside phosphorylase
MFNDLTKNEIYHLTMAMAHSGQMLDLSGIAGKKIDKHSTGGVGDKLTLLVAPSVSACGVPVAKMSGAGLGHTGGTIDKLNSIKGYKTEISFNEFINLINENGISIIGQTGEVAPVDKKIYALRDTTATVDNIGLIASSIMSKKLASGADAFVLDIKTGNGAFMKTPEDAKKLAETMLEIANQNGKEAKALITDMNQPLGFAIGNSLEIKEILNILDRKIKVKDIEEISIELAANMLLLAEKGNIEHCRTLAKEALENKSALEKFKLMIKAQGGNLEDLEMKEASQKIDISLEQEGYVISINAEKIGIAAMLLGAGRKTKEDKIDYTAGIVLNKKIGDYVKKGEPILTLHTNNSDSEKSAKLIKEAFIIGKEKPEEITLIYGSF